MTLSLGTTLSIPCVYLNDYYVRLWASFHNTWLRGENNVVKDMSSLKNFFDYVYGDLCLQCNIRCSRSQGMI